MLGTRNYQVISKQITWDMDTVPENGVFIFIVVVQTLVIARFNKVSLNSMERF